MIRIENFTVKYEAKLLDRVNLEIPSGKIVALIGKNGSGKSTLANVLAGLVTDFAGEIWLDDLRLTRHVKMCELRAKIGLVLQNPDHQILFNSVRDELEFVLRNLGQEKSFGRGKSSNQDQLEVMEAKIMKALTQVGMADFVDMDPQNLSGGQRQRIAIATMLVAEPRYLIFDEATSQLDDVGKQAIYQTMRKLAEQGIGVIMITNNLNELIYADEVLVIHDYKIQKLQQSEILRKKCKLEDYGFATPLTIKLAQKFGVRTMAEIEEKL